MFAKQGQQTAELRLNPEDLGQVHISLKLDNDQAQLQMVSAHGHVRAALEAALPVLRTSLAGPERDACCCCWDEDCCCPAKLSLLTLLCVS